MTSINLKLKVADVNVSDLKPYERNARTHSTKQIQKICASITEFGFVNPVLINKNKRIIAGHGRVEAARQLGFDTIPAICIEHLTEAQVKAYVIADNKLAEMAGWDNEILAIELQHLIDLDFNVGDLGFDENDLEKIIPATIDEDDEPEEVVPPDHAVSQDGDCWLLDKHRLFCGDATNSEDFELLMKGKKAAMTFTDPPYNVDYAGEEKGKKHRKILNDNLGNQFGQFLTKVFKNILQHTDGGVYACMAGSEIHVLQKAFLDAGGHWSTFIIWAKNMFTLGRSDYQRQYEPMLYGWREGVSRHWCGDRNQGDVWFFDKPMKSALHPTMKPIALVQRAIRNSSKRGDIVLDPFLGSGTTLIAANRLKRICYGMELDPRYVDVAIERWQNETGLKAVLDSGETFDGLKAGEKHD